jgi:hypothetical protein
MYQIFISFITNYNLHHSWKSYQVSTDTESSSASGRYTHARNISIPHSLAPGGTSGVKNVRVKSRRT